MSDLRSYFESRTQPMLEFLKELVAIESPTPDKAAVDRVGARIKAECEKLGGAVTVHPRSGAGDHIEARWNADAPGKPVFLFCHMDTVHPVGEIARNPIREENGLIYGPGSYDMKGSIVTTLEAVGGLLQRGELPGQRPTIVLVTSDEETGSHHSRALIEEIARGSAFAGCMEPAFADGSVKTWRKGVGAFELRITGRPAHAGIEPEKGINAIEEMAGQVLAIQGLTDMSKGTTVNVGIINGGTRSNVIPEYAYARIDARALLPEEMQRVEAAMQALKPRLVGAKLEVSGGFGRPPMPRNEVMVQTYERVSALAAAEGLTLRDSGSGGGSDGNFTAALGVPTLDGLGPAGDGAHTNHEHVQISGLARAATLTAAIIKGW